MVYAVKRKNDREYSADAASTLKYLMAFLKEESSVNPKIRAILSADKNVEHGRVVHYMDLLNRAQISRYAVSVEKPSRKPKKK